MGYLITEMAILLSISMLIAWLAGRYLCKSGERQEYDEKQACLIQLNELQNKQRKQQQHCETLEAENENLSQQLQSCSTQVEALEEERKQLILGVQKNSVYAAQIKSLSSELLNSETQLKSSLEEISSLTNSNKKLKTSLHQLQTSLNKEKDQASQQKIALQDLEEARKRQQIEQTLLQKKYDKTKKELHEALLQYNTKESKVNILSSEHDSIAKRLQNAEENNQQLTTELTQLQHIHEEISRKYEALNQLHHNHQEIIDKLTLERDDFLARLHAISSVVSAVGTEQKVET